MPEITGLALLNWYLYGTHSDKGRRDIANTAIMKIFHVKSMREEDAKLVQNYCAAVILIALQRLRASQAVAAMNGLGNALEIISGVSPDVQKQLPRDALWAIMKIAATMSNDDPRARDAAKRIATTEQPSTLEELERYIRDHFPEHP